MVVVVVMGVQVREVGWAVVVVGLLLLLLLLPGTGQRLQEHLLGGDRAERHKTSSGAGRTQRLRETAADTYKHIFISTNQQSVKGVKCEYLQSGSGSMSEKWKGFGVA